MVKAKKTRVIVNKDGKRVLIITRVIKKRSMSLDCGEKKMEVKKQRSASVELEKQSNF